MRKILYVVRNEIITGLNRKSFLIMAFGLPIIAVLVLLGVSALRGNSGNVPSTPNQPSSTSELEFEGYVDHSGLIETIHPDVPEGILVRYSDEDSAARALRAGDISAYYVIPADYIQSGDLIYVNPDFTPITSSGQSWVMRHTLFVNLLGNDPERIQRAWPPMDVQVKALSPPKTERDEENPLTFYVPYGTMMLIYVVIVMSASLLLNSVTDEKKNRVMEILLVSVSPRQILTGKIIGLGALGLLQAVLWVGTGYALLRIAGHAFSLPSEFQLPASMLIWGIVFFLLGFAVYASQMAGLGALAPNLQEASQATIVVIWPMLVPLFFLVSLIENPNGPLAIGLSLFPLTAPPAMMARLAVDDVPLWQPVLSAVLMVVAAAIIVRAVAAIFQAQTLLSGQPMSLKRYYRTLLGRTSLTK